MNFQTYCDLLVEMPHVYVSEDSPPLDLQLETVPKNNISALIKHLHYKLPRVNRVNIVNDLFQDSLFLNILQKYFHSASPDQIKSRLISLTL